VDPVVVSAIALAPSVHAKQQDKGGAPYLDHPLRVMAAVTGVEAKVVATLHDVMEDTLQPHVRGDIYAMLAAHALDPRPILEALEALTRRSGEPYETFIERVASNDLATRVKLADLCDNLDASRMAAPDRGSAETLTRMQRYRAAVARLTVRGG
jgi:guanosine-3',5'-bis(diphosphate) 3'-pyrophosphohydrolase